MSIVWERTVGDTRCQVRRAGHTLRLYTNGVFHSQYNPQRPVTGNVWDLLMLPAFFYPPAAVRRVLVLGVGGGAVIRQLQHFIDPETIVGVELSALHLAVARRFFGVRGKTVSLHRADAEAWLQAYSGAPFDMIIDDLFGDVAGEPVRAVRADARWAGCILGHLAPDGVAVSNFPSRDDLQRSAFLAHKSIRASFDTAFCLATPQNCNAVGVFLKQPATPRQLRNRLYRVPELDPRRASSRLQYSIRTLGD